MIEEVELREVEEETGFVVELMCKIGTYQEKATDPVKHSYQGRILSGHLVDPNDEIMDSTFLSFETITDMLKRNELRGTWVWERIAALHTSV